MNFLNDLSLTQRRGNLNISTSRADSASPSLCLSSSSCSRYASLCTIVIYHGTCHWIIFSYKLSTISHARARMRKDSNERFILIQRGRSMHCYADEFLATFYSSEYFLSFFLFFIRLASYKDTNETLEAFTSRDPDLALRIFRRH